MITETEHLTTIARYTNELGFLQGKFASARANCFNAVQMYFGHATMPMYCGPEEYVRYLQRQFQQIDAATSPAVVVVWSRTSNELEKGQIKIERMQKKLPGYPFGLVIEHSFVIEGDGLVFQKADPTPATPYQHVEIRQALEPYIAKPGFEITYHQLRN